MTETIMLHLIKFLLITSILILAIEIFVHTRRQKINIIGTPKKFLTAFGIGFITDLLDTWGIGSFATTTTFFKLTHFIDDNDDSQLPGTMNVGHAIAVLIEALFFITAVKVEMMTLIPMTSAAIAGALTGTRITKNWPAKLVQRVLGVLLVIAAIIMATRLLFNIGADMSTSSHGLHGILLIVGVSFNFVLGVLMTMGLGNYAPELVFFSLAGVNPMIALPVMMLDAAMIMFSSAQEFIKKDRVYWNGLLGMMIGGIFGVIVAAKVITNIDIELLKKAMVVIVIYTGIMLIRSSFGKEKN
ncbi:membrane protein [Lactococcus hodotermopsidis]|uniref:Probable membrane transporter protein n=1 Tax=Pseudolactococcus hodotermopsidis TaxID=2709157 RepID=A0A6A0B7T0_9LACT|nr:sulfite exporter TauE/SafE family protein [Lactococcus hodotermopsidis]GFH41469.1 membrane protein [Lactococcus hodotermopsidis]